jgi:putative endonuclease
MAGVSKGAAGEVLAARFLRDKGYEIWTANYRCRFGEIDIIAVDDPYIAFVEVKTRSEDALYAPCEAVTEKKQRRILKTAMLYIQSNHSTLQPRFDVIDIITKKNRPMEIVEIDHIQNAFETGDLHAAF